MFEILNQAAIQMTVDDNEVILDQSVIKEINVFSSLSHFLPSIEIKFNDKANMLTEVTGITGGETLGLQYAIRSELMNNTPFQFRVGSIKSPSAEISRPQGTLLELHGHLVQAPAIFKPVRNRAFAGMTSFEVANQIVVESGFAPSIASFVNGKVELTDDAQTWIQANWTNAQMLRHLALRAVSADGSGAYLYGFDKDASFIYASTNYLYRQPVRRRYVWTNDPVNFDEQSVSQNSRRQALAPEQVIYEFGAMLPRDFMGMTGGDGTTIQYFDFATKQFIRTPFTVQTQPRIQLSERTTVPRKEVNPETRNQDFGRLDENSHLRSIHAVGYDQVFRRVGSSSKLFLIVRGDNTVRVGEKVDVKIESAVAEQMFHTVFNGAWIVLSVTDSITQQGYYTKLILGRDGNNMGIGGSFQMIGSTLSSIPANF